VVVSNLSMTLLEDTVKIITRDGNQFLYKVVLVLVFQNFGLMILVLVLVFKILQNNFGFGYGFQNFGLMILVLVMVFKIFKFGFVYRKY